MAKTLFIVTGASGGFGSAILRQINSLHGSQAAIIACSRNQEAVLQNTQDFSAAVEFTSVDFAQREDINGRCQAMLRLYGNEKFSEVVLVNNHASVNDVSRLVAEFDDCKEIDDYMFLNFTSFQILTALFLKEFRETEGTAVSVLNISSLASIQGLSSLSLYCAGKGARMMLYKTLAVEYPDVNVMNYSPGPMATAMTSNFSTDSASSMTRQFFENMASTNTFVDADESAKKMLTLLKVKDFTSGDQIDFYDR